MNAETDAYYGRPDPSSTYKWGLALPSQLPPGLWPERHPWKVVAWFKTRKACDAYAFRVHSHQPHGICRAYL